MAGVAISCTTERLPLRLYEGDDQPAGDEDDDGQYGEPLGAEISEPPIKKLVGCLESVVDQVGGAEVLQRLINQPPRLDGVDGLAP